MLQSSNAWLPNMLRLRGCVATLTLFVASAVPASGQAQNIAVVNGKAVPTARVEVLMPQVLRRGGQGEPRKRTPELDSQVRDEVVMREILEQEAVEQGLANSPDFKMRLELARQSLLIGELFSSFQKKNPVSNAAVEAEYDKFKAKQSGTEYRARHILVEKESEAKTLIAQIKGKDSAKFEALAKKHSKDLGSGAKGGDLGWAGAGAYVPEFSQAMAKLKKGEVTANAVKSQFGFHIIKLEDTRPARFPALAEVRARIQQGLARAKLAKYRDKLRSKAKTDYKFSR